MFDLLSCAIARRSLPPYFLNRCVSSILTRDLQCLKTSMQGGNSKADAQHETIAYLCGSANDLNGDSSISSKQRKYEVTSDMIIKLPVISGYLCGQENVRPIVPPNLLVTLPVAISDLN
ncbi:hypothetical protein PIB30_067769 [Stylosanthes scabra]|uniref:Uncharacterized protein n=1 Tax=Stylosanthes scabra TaxID=79078 RepID=A0ABU6XLM2_9FABA|nr:hypothetical protein [Stylosanthes scabra]